jgi:hypothetical protein
MQLRTSKTSIYPFIVLTGLLAAADAHAESQDPILQRLQALEENQQRLETELAEREERIQELEQRLGIRPGAANQLYSYEVVPQGGARTVETARPGSTASAAPDEGYGKLNPGGAGYRIAETPYGALNFSAWT